MKRSKEILIGEAIRQFLREEGLETPFNEHRLISSWGEVMGKVVQRYTGNLRIINEVLHVEITSASLRADLMMQRTDLTRRLNEHIGAHVIRDIVFY